MSQHNKDTMLGVVPAEYPGWFTTDQDTTVSDKPNGEGSVLDVRQPVEFLTGLNMAEMS